MAQLELFVKKMIMKNEIVSYINTIPEMVLLNVDINILIVQRVWWWL